MNIRDVARALASAVPAILAPFCSDPLGPHGGGGAVPVTSLAPHVTTTCLHEMYVPRVSEIMQISLPGAHGSAAERVNRRPPTG